MFTRRTFAGTLFASLVSFFKGHTPEKQGLPAPCEVPGCGEDACCFLADLYEELPTFCDGLLWETYRSGARHQFCSEHSRPSIQQPLLYNPLDPLHQCWLSHLAAHPEMNRVVWRGTRGWARISDPSTRAEADFFRRGISEGWTISRMCEFPGCYHVSVIQFPDGKGGACSLCWACYGRHSFKGQTFREADAAAVAALTTAQHQPRDLFPGMDDHLGLPRRN